MRRFFLIPLVLLSACATPPPPPPSSMPVPQSTAAVAPEPVKPARAAETGTLTVTVRSVLPGKSTLLVGLYDEAHYKQKKPPFSRDGPAKSPETVVVFTDLKPGRYAVKILQDMNGNHDMDSTLLGVPEEPFGLSNDVQPQLALPGFGETSFEVKPGANAIVIHLQQM